MTLISYRFVSQFIHYWQLGDSKYLISLFLEFHVLFSVWDSIYWGLSSVIHSNIFMNIWCKRLPRKVGGLYHTKNALKITRSVRIAFILTLNYSWKKSNILYGNLYIFNSVDKRSLGSQLNIDGFLLPPDHFKLHPNVHALYYNTENNNLEFGINRNVLLHYSRYLIFVSSRHLCFQGHSSRHTDTF